MRYVVTIALTLALLTLAISPAVADKSKSPSTAAVGEMAPDFTLTDANGKKHSLSDFEGKYVVLEWINFGCPFVKKHYHSGNMQKLQDSFMKKDVVWLSICSSAPGKQGHYAGKNLLAQIKKEKWQATAYLVDESGEVGKLFQAKTTPNMYVIDPKGKLVYAGAIDSTPSANADDIAKSVNYVSDALTAAMAGKEIKVKATQPYGCSVKYSKKK